MCTKTAWYLLHVAAHLSCLSTRYPYRRHPLVNGSAGRHVRLPHLHQIISTLCGQPTTEIMSRAITEGATQNESHLGDTLRGFDTATLLVDSVARLDRLSTAFAICRVQPRRLERCCSLPIWALHQTVAQSEKDLAQEQSLLPRRGRSRYCWSSTGRDTVILVVAAASGPECGQARSWMQRWTAPALPIDISIWCLPRERSQVC
jgi:hypothetical protein